MICFVLAWWIINEFENDHANIPTRPTIIPWSRSIIFSLFVVIYITITQLNMDAQTERWVLMSERAAALLNLCTDPTFTEYLRKEKNDKIMARMKIKNSQYTVTLRKKENITTSSWGSHFPLNHSFTVPILPFVAPLHFFLLRNIKISCMFPSPWH